MNLGSAAQLQHFFFGKYLKKVFQPEESEKTFKLDKSDEELAAEQESVMIRNKYVNLTSEAIKIQLKDRGIKCARSGSKKADLIYTLLLYDVYVKRSHDLQLRSYDDLMTPDASLNIVTNNEDSNTAASSSLPADDAGAVAGAAVIGAKVAAPKKKKTAKPKELTFFEKHIEALRHKYTDEQVEALIKQDDERIQQIIDSTDKVKSYKEFTILSLCMSPEEFTPAGSPQVSTSVLRKLAGKNLNDEKGEQIITR